MNKTYSDLDSIIQLSKDSETQGFDLSTGQSWIYPTNYQIRDYQFNITQAALHNNTLVSLPTGLGKTFIAAVVMYNFYRWYPMGKIIFMAPTKPLVKQQQDACYNIMAIPPDATAEMTGNKLKATRVKIWKEKRVFFITPQILQNDIDVVLDLAEQIKCIVIDEAHKALGKHANCEAIKKIHNINKYFRVLALSATPGSNFNSVKDVVTNLLISHIESRTNESVDVAPYVFNRKMETFVIPIIGELFNVKNKYIMILDKYTRPLLQFNIFTGNCANLSKGRIVLTMKEFKERGRQHPKYSYILKTLNLCVTLYHGYELLIRHGLRGFLVFFDGTISKPLINSIQELHEILNDVRNFLGPIEEIGILPDGTIPEVEGPTVYSHPKFKKLNEILIEHFKAIEDGDTRVMVFCEYRESVMEIYQMLLRQRPLVKPRVFLGQGAISQAQQIQAVKQFRCGTCNTLISTCIGEEGLDVGEVDLIVCFDISSKSPIRMVQRMGRTGRKRDGRVVVLVTEGKEQQLLSECMVQKHNMNSLLEAQPIKQHLYQNNPKMIPDNIQPQCNKMFITVKSAEKPKKKEDNKKKVKVTKNSNTLKTMFENVSSLKKPEEDQSKICKSPVKALRGAKKNQPALKNQMDLRSMFSKINSTQISQESSQGCIQESNEKIEECPELNIIVNKIKSYLNTSVINKTSCKICDILDSKIVCTERNNVISTKWTKPNLSILDSITSASLTKFSQSITFRKNNTFNTTNECTILNENRNSTIKCSNNLTAKTISTNNSLQYFNLESTSDVFSDNSTESPEYLIEDPIIFNKSLGIFESSHIYHTPMKTNFYEREEGKTTKTTQNVNTSAAILNTSKENNFFEDEVGSLVISDSESTSPVLCTPKSTNYKQKIQQRLFSQSQRNIDSTSSDLVQPLSKLKTLNLESNKLLQSTSVCKNLNTDLIDSNIHNVEKENVKNANTSTPKFFKTNISAVENANINTINTNMSTPKNINDLKNNHNTNFWDESLFEIFDSDESLFEDETKASTNKNSASEQAEKQNTEEKLNVSAEHNDTDNDSDATIILSFDTDKIFDDIEQDNLKNKKQCVNTVAIINKSECNQTIDSSLLSVTQAIDLLNDSKFKSQNNSLKINDSKNLEIINQSLRSETLKNNLQKISIIEENRQLKNSDNKKLTTDPIINDFGDNNINETNSKDKKVNEEKDTFIDDLVISDIFEDFDDTEEEFSLLNFSQNRKRKLHQSQKNSKGNNSKISRTSIDIGDQKEIQSNRNVNNNKNISIINLVCDNGKEKEKTVNNFQETNILKNKNFDNLENYSQKNLEGNNSKVSRTSIDIDEQKKIQSDTNVDNNKKTSIINLVCDNGKEKEEIVNNFQETNILKDKNFDNNLEDFSQKTKKMRNKKFKLSTIKNSTEKSNETNKKDTRQIKNPVIVLSDSDDDFDIRPTLRSVSKLITPVKAKRTNRAPSCSSNKLNENTNKTSKTSLHVLKTRSQSSDTKTKNIKLKKKKVCAFIDDEAEVEEDEHYISDSDSEKDSDELLLDNSFVSHTQQVHDETDMKVKYLQSIRSPIFKPGAFKMPHRPPLQVYDNVFSQVENYENDTYMDDSFCVDNDQVLTQREEMSYLEMVEAQLEKKTENKRNKKRKRIITISDSD